MEEDLEEIEQIKKKLEDTDIQVPLVVKKNNNNKRIIEKTKKTTDGRLSNGILLCIIVLLLLITSYVIINRIIESNTKTVLASTNKIKEYTYLKKWLTIDDEAFVFEQDKTFYWYSDKDNTNNNYYSGKYTVKKGLDAVKEMGYNEKDFTNTFGSKIEQNNIYSFEIVPDTAYIDGVDKTDTYLPNNTKWWFILIIKSDGSAIAYNKTLDIRYHLK